MPSVELEGEVEIAFRSKHLCIGYRIPYRALSVPVGVVLAQYIFLYVLLLIIFVKVGRGIKVALMMYCVTSFYDTITSRTMRVIWDVNSVLLACPGLAAAFGTSFIVVPSLWGEQERMTLPSLSPS